MKRKILIILGGIVLFDIVFFAALFWMLPTDSISHLLEAHIERALKQEQIVKIGDLSITPWMTATVSQFQMTPLTSAPVDESLAMEGGNFNGFYCAPYVEQQSILIDEIYVNPDVFGILGKKYGGNFELKILDGKVDGEVKTKGSIVEIKANGKQISLNEFALVSNFSGMQVYGDLEFAVRAILNAGLQAAEEENKDAENAETEEAAAGETDRKSGRKNRNRQNRNQRKSKSGDSDSMLAEASIDVKSSMTAMCPKRLKLGTIPLDLPFTVFGNIEAELELKENKLIINKLTSDGPDIKLDVKGDVLLKSKTNANPRLNIHAVIQPSESWVTDNGMKVIYQMCEKHPDGSIELDLRGPVNRLKHDCGTPIPEPEPEKTEVEKAEAEKDTKEDKPKTKENKAKEDKKDAEKKDSAKREKKKPVRPEEEDKPTVEKNGFSPDSVMHVRSDRMLEETPSERAERGSRRSRAGGSNAVPSPAEFKTRSARVNQDLERVNEMATQDMKRRGRGRERERMPNFGRGVPGDAE